MKVSKDTIFRSVAMAIALSSGLFVNGLTLCSKLSNVLVPAKTGVYLNNLMADSPLSVMLTSVTSTGTPLAPNKYWPAVGQSIQVPGFKAGFDEGSKVHIAEFSRFSGIKNGVTYQFTQSTVLPDGTPLAFKQEITGTATGSKIRIGIIARSGIEEWFEGDSDEHVVIVPDMHSPGTSYVIRFKVQHSGSSIVQRTMNGLVGVAPALWFGVQAKRVLADESQEEREEKIKKLQTTSRIVLSQFAESELDSKSLERMKEILNKKDHMAAGEHEALIRWSMFMTSRSTNDQPVWLERFNKDIYDKNDLGAFMTGHMKKDVQIKYIDNMLAQNDSKREELKKKQAEYHLEIESIKNQPSYKMNYTSPLILAAALASIAGANYMMTYPDVIYTIERSIEEN